MSSSGTGNLRHFCLHCKDWLATIPEIQCHSPPLPLNQTIIDVSLSIHPDNTVTDDRIILTDGIPDHNYQRGTGYEVRISDGQKTIWNTTMNIYFDYNGPVETGVDYSKVNFDSFAFHYRIPYNNSMQKLELNHNKTLIFSKDLNFCNSNGTCDSTETHQTCPKDCPLDQRDGVCSKTQDNVCDPDCLPDVDPDCRSSAILPVIIAGAGIAACAGAGIWYLVRKKKPSQQ